MNKLNLTSPQHAIYNNPNYGPTLGGFCIYISDRAHENNNSNVNPATCYKSVMFENNQ
jgi:hypothetical protein